jgi:hypothetical protein
MLTFVIVLWVRAVWTNFLCFSLVPIFGDYFSCSFSWAASYWLTHKAMDRNIAIIQISSFFVSITHDNEIS